MAGGSEQRAKSLFVAALDVATTERAAFLAERCGGDAALTRRVERLLDAHEQAGTFLAEPPDRATSGAAALEPGDELTAYRIVSRLGAGGMGTVYVAELVRPAGGMKVGARVALKVVHAHLLETEGFFKRFLREARVGNEVEQENVVRTLDCDAVARRGHQHHFLVMEYVEGQTLRELLQELRRVPEELCRHIGREVARGLSAIHGLGAVHRDIKPENVLITPEHVVKVMDLGVARLQDEALRLSRAGGFVGSLEYAAPEQFEQAGNDTDARSDLYSLGVVLYELATGQHPYRDDNSRTVLRRILQEEPRRAGAVNPQLSPYFEEVVHTLIAKDPDERFASAEELVTALEDGAAGPWWKARAQGLRIQTKKPLRRIRIPRETALCGRNDELGNLRAQFEAAKAGDGRVALIDGEAGIGKTRLVDEFAAQLLQDGEDVHFLYGSHAPGGAAMAAGAFSEAYREHFGQSGSSQYLQQAPLLVPAFDAFLRSEPPPNDAIELTSESLATCFIHATRSIAAERPAVLLIDDLHFASEESRALFAQLATAIQGHRVLLVGTMRPGVPDGWIAALSRMDQTSHLSLGRLGPKDLTQLLVDAFQSERLAEELGFRIAHKSDGNPFFAFEIIRGLREGRFISQRPDGTWFRTSVIEDIQVPSSVADLIHARLQELSEQERELLDVASCVGFRFNPEVVGRVVGMDVVPALRTFGRIESRHRLVRSAGADLVFDHHQVQESLHEGLLERLRTRYHAAIAEVLDAQSGGAEHGGDLDGALCVELCGHYLMGARGERALVFLGPALRHLKANFLSEQAVAMARRALALPDMLVGDDRLEVLLVLNDRLDLLGHRAAQEEVLTEARALADPNDSRSLLKVERGAAELSLGTGKYPEAQARFERCLVLARDIGDRRAEADATGSLGAAAFFQGRYPAAEAQSKRHLAMAREMGDLRGEIRAERYVIAALTRRGLYDEAQEHIPRLLALARESGDPKLEGEALGAVSFAVVSRGHYEEAREHVERCLEVTRAIGYRRGEAVATGNLGLIFWGLGFFDQAREQIERWARLAGEVGDRTGESAALGNLGQVLMELGRFEEAQANLERQLALAREVGGPQSEARIIGSLGEIRLTQGQYSEARNNLEQQLAMARESGDRKQQAHAMTRLGDLSEDEGDLAGAEGLHEQALALRRELSDAYVTAPLIGLARIAMRRGDTSAAQACVDEALTVAREHKRASTILLATMLRALLPGGRVSDLLGALDEYGERTDFRTELEVRFRLWQSTGDETHLGEAHRLLQFALEHTPPKYRRSMVENVPLHAKINTAWDQSAP